jgi:K+-sensing histidine kinase KdpD
MDSTLNAPEEDESLIYLAGGGIAAIFLGMVLVPLRDYTTASNFAFPFMALTITVAEFGGRRAAVVTALTSALSLDFFLTQPYLRLTIAGKHDLIAFLGLAACGLVAAAFGSGRRRRNAALRAARGHLDLLHSALQPLETTGPIEPVLTRILDEALAALPLAALLARDETGKLLAASGAQPDSIHPRQVLRPDTLLPVDASERIPPRGGLPLPEQGARLPLVAGNKQVGWLELWGSGARADAAARHALSDVARLVGILLIRSQSDATRQ